MNKNIHDKERILRGILGVIITSMAFIGPANPWFLLGLIPLGTALVGSCALYSALGISTRKMQNNNNKIDIEDDSYFHKA